MKYQWRVLQLLPEAERPSYAGVRVDVLERADGEMMIRYQGEVVDLQEGPPPSSALWGAGSGCSTDPEQEKVTDGAAISHLDMAKQALLTALASPDEDDANVDGAVTRRRAVRRNCFATSCTGRPRRPSRPAGRQ